MCAVAIGIVCPSFSGEIDACDYSAVKRMVSGVDTRLKDGDADAVTVYRAGIWSALVSCVRSPTGRFEMAGHHSLSVKRQVFYGVIGGKSGDRTCGDLDRHRLVVIQASEHNSAHCADFRRQSAEGAAIG